MTKTHIPPLKFAFLTPIYDLFCSIFGFGAKFRDKIMLHTPLNQGDQVLDFGCGTGVFSRIIKIKEPDAFVFGIDPDSKALEIAKKKTLQQNLKIDYLIGGAQKIPFSDNKFDLVTSTLVFHHLPTELKKEALKEIKRVLKPGGVFILTDLGKPKSKIWTFMSLFTVYFEEGRDNYEGKISLFMQEAGFKNIKIVGESRKNVHIISANK
jgi:ubiquinone/menaquinone biosynthesis C-methylase UbiE